MAKTYKVRYKKVLPQRIQYAGSLIQQNFSEDLDKGYLLWDIKSRDNFDSTFHTVENDYGFYTIHADKGELPDVELPPKCRVRVIWPVAERDISRALVNELTQLVHQKYNPLSVRIDFKPKKSKHGHDLDVDAQLDVRELNVQQDLLKKWLTAHDLPEDMTTEVLEIDKAIYEKANTLEFEDFSQSQWKINSITIRDFMSYKGPETIDFRKLKGTIGLFGDNRSGKSVLIDAILYALFNKTTRSVKNHDLINKVTKAKKCSVQLNITIRGVEYEITRVTKMQFKKRTGEYTWTRTDLVLKRVHGDGSIEDLTETQRNETEKIIRNAIGSFDDFLITTLTTQSSQHEFIYQNAGTRAENMTRFLGLEIFNKKHDIAKDILREADSARKIHNLEAKSKMLASAQQKAETTQQVIKERKKERKEKLAELAKRNGLLDTLRDSINKAITVDKTRGEIDAEIGTVQREIELLKLEIESIRGEAEKMLNEAYSAEAQLVELSSTEETAVEQLPDLLDAESQIANRIQALKEYARALRDDASSNATCPVGELPETKGCIFVQRQADKKAALLSHMEKIEQLNQKSVAIARKIEKARKAKQKLDSNEQIHEQIQRSSRWAKDFESQIDLLESRLDTKTMALTMLTDKLDIITNNEEIVKKNRQINEQIDEVKKQIRELQDSCDRLTDEITTASSDHAVAIARIEELEALIAEISTNDRKYELYNWYTKAMHRNGIPMTVLRKYIPVINYELNRILSSIVGFGVYFKIDDASDNIDIVMRYDDVKDDTRPITMASGMEKFISNMAIRHVLLKISALSKPTLRIIDEGFDVLDNDNVYLVQKFFEQVKGEFDNIVIITHIDALKDCADHVVTVSQSNGVSKLRLN